MGMRIFAEGELREYLESQLGSLEEEVRREHTNRLLNCNETEYIQYLASKYSVDVLQFNWDELSVSDREEMILAQRFPHGFLVDPGRCYAKQVITYYIPFSGSADLLKLAPSRRILWTTEVAIKGNSICFDIINWADDPAEIKRDADEVLTGMRRQADSVEADIRAWNESVEGEATRVVRARKAQLLKQSNILASLGVPLKHTESVSPTFAIPAPKKRLVVQKPSAPTTPYSPEPALDPETYRAILDVCHGFGVEMERHPSVYRDKDEDTLRDHFIMLLSPHFHSVSGETFNRSGKTDILIRHEGKNVFVGECKFWRGAKAYHQAIDQLLGYLTWRDSKAAILLFVQNKELEPVLQEVEEFTLSHPCFVKYRGRAAQGWFDFAFHLLEDRTREVHLAVLCFHLPPAKSNAVEVH